MRKRAEKIFAAIVGAIPLPGAYHGLSDAENVKSVIEVELTAAVREEREKWEKLEAAAREVLAGDEEGKMIPVANGDRYAVAIRVLAALTEAP